MQIFIGKPSLELPTSNLMTYFEHLERNIFYRSIDKYIPLLPLLSEYKLELTLVYSTLSMNLL